MMVVVVVVVVERREPVATSLSALEGISIARIYLTRFDVNSNTMAALSITENDKFRVLKNVNKQQVLSRASITSELDYILKALCSILLVDCITYTSFHSLDFVFSSISHISVKWSPQKCKAQFHCRILLAIGVVRGLTESLKF